jgi:hypothetical protein
MCFVCFIIFMLLSLVFVLASALNFLRQLRFERERFLLQASGDRSDQANAAPAHYQHQATIGDRQIQICPMVVFRRAKDDHPRVDYFLPITLPVTAVPKLSSHR